MTAETEPLISICIPAYKRPHYLRRVLESITIQTFRSFEVIVTDDSDDDAVQNVITEYESRLPLKYHRNVPALGTPRNWLKGAELAQGEWIKIVHDDDWFFCADSLQHLADGTTGTARLIFSGYDILREKDGTTVRRLLSQAQFSKYLKKPFLVFDGNLLGPPSILMTHRTVKETYRPDMKWYVDQEFYIRALKLYPAAYVPKVAMVISHNDSQVTGKVFANPNYEIPEALAVLASAGYGAVKNIIFYDAWWRLLRRLRIRTETDWSDYASGTPIPRFLQRMIRFQCRIPLSILHIRPIFKILMVICYLLYGRKYQQ